MKRYTEEDIYRYLDEELSTQQRAEFEQALAKTSELRQMLAQARNAHQAFSQNSLEKAPPALSTQVMNRIKASSKGSYYRPAGLFSNTGFLLISGVLTALVAVLSIINGGYLELQSLAPSMVQVDALTDSRLWQILSSKKIVTNAMLVLYGILGLILLDRFVFHPYFHSRIKQLEFR
jgi:anti-sigma-K factor RskA